MLPIGHSIGYTSIDYMISQKYIFPNRIIYRSITVLSHAYNISNLQIVFMCRLACHEIHCKVLWYITGEIFPRP